MGSTVWVTCLIWGAPLGPAWLSRVSRAPGSWGWLKGLGSCSLPCGIIAAPGVVPGGAGWLLTVALPGQSLSHLGCGFLAHTPRHFLGLTSGIGRRSLPGPGRTCA